MPPPPLPCLSSHRTAAGKGALVVGALDERFALVVAQESGSGGAASWRISDYENELYGPNTVQSLHEITGENVWFEDSFKQFDDTATKLPFEHHELHGLVAPRGLLVIENLDYIWVRDRYIWVNYRVGRTACCCHS